jgi:hypothetical protein
MKRETFTAEMRARTAKPPSKPVPPVARSGAETKAQMDRVNNAPVRIDLRAAPWCSAGGGAGFRIR